MDRFEDGDLIIVRGGPAGAWQNNIYLLIDRATGEAAFVDAPDEPEKAVALAEAAGVRPAKILLTHSHADHTAGLAALKARFGCRLYADPAEPWLPEEQLDEPVRHGQEIRLGNVVLRVLSVPGHTPGSTAYVAGRSAFVGETLFPGGPGRSQSPEALRQEIASIVAYLYTLPDDTVVYPGHGPTTTIGESKAEYAVFASRPHPPDLCGDVRWLES
ncbi:MAG: hydroxyacylglutathione hydrolase family protein [Chloroflexota bacterium]|nr:hydroxyacylglutathione hydrolase family protein [Dehalococcoidia bacterium]MDW8047277.1 hydroxyacylglutathione hydrolase family protein [Chloroflexota bacterium]